MKTIRFITLIFVTILFLITNQLFAVKHIIHVGNFYFTPSSLSSNVGDTIRWVWDGGSHTTTSSTIPSGAQGWDSPISSAIPSFEYKISVAGTYNYLCTPHASMGQVGSFTAAGAAPTLNVSPVSRNVSAASGSTTFTVTSNSAWTAISNAAWCTVTSGGSGNGTIVADYTENTSLSPRSAIITVSVSGIPSQTVTVNQAGALPVLSVSPPNQNAGAASGSTSFSVNSNTAWSAVSNADWCTVTPSGSGNGVLTAEYLSNVTDQVRIAVITVSASGVPNQLVTVTQDRSTVGLNYQPESNLTVYPNPTRGLITLSLAGNSSSNQGNYRIYNSKGYEILSGGIQSTDLKLNLEGNPTGIYLLKVVIGNSTLFRKIELVE